MEKTTQNLEEQFPSVKMAYPIAVASYEIALRRLDMMDGRIQTISAFTVSVFGGIVTFVASKNISFYSFWFVFASLLFLTSVATAIYARHYGEILLLKPSNLFKGWLADSEWQFQKDMIDRAGNAFDENMNLVTVKWQFSVLLSLLFALEVLGLAVWVLVCLP